MAEPYKLTPARIPIIEEWLLDPDAENRPLRHEAWLLLCAEREARASAEAIVARLPHTKDGVPAFEHDVIFSASGEEGCVRTNGADDWYWSSYEGREGDPVSECYSSEDAARKAGESHER